MKKVPVPDADALAREQEQLVAVCPQCQARILYTNPVNRDRGFEIYTCLGCGYEQGVEVLPALPKSDRPLPPDRVVSVRWKHGAPSVAEIMSLRQLVPRYADASIAELRDTLARPELRLGELTPRGADQLISRGEALGLELVARDVEGDG
jgi:Zn ribbon nucleic-acid-binding protein